MIAIESLTKKYHSTVAVDHVSFVAEPGRVTGFLGPNGAGKSTSMRMLVGLTAPTSGTATISGRRFADLPNPGLEVGVMLDASAQHAGRTGRRSSPSPSELWGCRPGVSTRCWSWSASPRPRRTGGSVITRSACASGSGSPPP